MGLNDGGPPTCPHGWIVTQRLELGGWIQEIAPECCNLCPPGKLLERYRAPGQGVKHIAKAKLKPARGSMGLFGEDAT